jgi:hypothetical protein
LPRSSELSTGCQRSFHHGQADRHDPAKVSQATQCNQETTANDTAPETAILLGSPTANHLPGRRRTAAGPARRRADRPQGRAPRGLGKAVTPHTLRHAFITAALDAGVPLRDVREAASHADPRTTIRHDRARGSLDRHATCIVAAYIAGAAR